ncbi:MAG: response regulator [Rhodobacterales bacterium]|nr:MAG: response regulator [Rhodobacterales bacterium]
MDHIAAQIPFLRRYARALTGSQRLGDRFASAVLEALIAAPDRIPAPDQARASVFKLFHEIWDAARHAEPGGSEAGLAARAQLHLSKLTKGAREALLLSAMEEFSTADVAHILGCSEAEAKALVATGRRELAEAAKGRVLIIEDEPIIAMDIESIVGDAGHEVIGIAQTRREAMNIGGCEKPDLILADIRLADESSGLDAVNDLLATHGDDVPVIFITAYPERFLTGDRPEPAFLITKPFREEQVLSSVSQALFFASTETLG